MVAVGTAASARVRRLRDREGRDAHDSRVPEGGLRSRGFGLAEVRGDGPALLPSGEVELLMGDASKAKRS